MDTCKHCPDQIVKWIERAPHEMHRYKVVCARCRRMIKWGTDEQLANVMEHDRVMVMPYEKPASIEHFFR